MYKVAFIITRKGENASNDDKIIVDNFGDERDLYTVKYISPEFTTSKEFVANESQVLHYLEDVLTSIGKDTDPYHEFQLNTLIHPSVMYEIADLCDDEIRRMIMNMTYDCLRFTIRNA